MTLHVPRFQSVYIAHEDLYGLIQSKCSQAHPLPRSSVLTSIRGDAYALQSLNSFQWLGERSGENHFGRIGSHTDRDEIGSWRLSLSGMFSWFLYIYIEILLES